jgi:peptide chain release factor 1
LYLRSHLLTPTFLQPSPIACFKKLREQQDEVKSWRLAQVGTGSRSEKIRTYNYKDNRATDHRLGENFSLNTVLEGDIEGIIQTCISQDQQERLAELAASTN